MNKDLSIFMVILKSSPIFFQTFTRVVGRRGEIKPVFLDKGHISFAKKDTLPKGAGG